MANFTFWTGWRERRAAEMAEAAAAGPLAICADCGRRIDPDDAELCERDDETNPGGPALAYFLCEECGGLATADDSPQVDAAGACFSDADSGL